MKINNIKEENIISSIFLIGGLAAIIMWFTDINRGLLSKFDIYMLPIVAASLLISFFGILKYPNKKNVFYILAYSTVCFQMQTSWILSLFVWNGTYVLSSLSIFLPALYLTSHFFFKINATKISFINYFLLLTSGLIFLLNGQNPEKHQLVVSCLMSHPVYILSLHFIVMLRKKSIEDEMIKNHFKDQLEKDNLTGAFNRMFLSNLFKSDVEQIETGNINSMTLFMIDIDHFKKINDTLGHLVGDTILKQVYETIQRNIRKNDILVRWGGEEFVLLTKEKNIESLQTLGNKILKSVMEISPGGKLPNVTVSIGIAIRRKKELAKDLLNYADHALYESKNTGRNKITFYQIEDYTTIPHDTKH